MKSNELVSAAKAEIGVKETPPNSNNVKYNTWYYGHPVSGANYPWCMVFVQWLFRNVSMLIKTASCSTLLRWSKQEKCFYTEPKVGDIVFFKFDKSLKAEAQHCGIVVEVLSGGKIKSVEGNTSSGNIGSQDNGGCVALRTRSKSTIVGYCRPKYSDESKPSPYNPTVKHPTLRLGDVGEEVVYLQNKLRGFKYGCPTTGTFEKITELCVINLQATYNLKVDGIVGPETWKVIEG